MSCEALTETIHSKASLLGEGPLPRLKPSHSCPYGSVGGEAAMESVVLGPQHFDILKLIGEGGFGQVYLVRNQLASAEEGLHAMKVVSKRLLRKKNHLSYMRAERDILTQVSHPFIVGLRYAFQTDTKVPSSPNNDFLLKRSCSFTW